jgi:stage III sporulation protein AG
MAEDKPIFDFSYQELFKKLQRKPSLIWLILGLIALGFFLLLTGNGQDHSSSGNSGVTPSQTEDSSDSAVATRRQLEAELSRTLAAIDGVGRVRVELNIKSGSRKVWERQLNVTKRVSQEQGSANTEESNNDQLVLAKSQDGRDVPVLKEELAPEIQGVIVVATGANDARIKELLIQTVMTILDLPAHRVMVIPGTVEEGTGK